MVLPGILKFFAKGANRNELLCLPVLLDSLHVLMNKYSALRHLVASLLVLLWQLCILPMGHRQTLRRIALSATER